MSDLTTIKAIALKAMIAYSDPHKTAAEYRVALLDICNTAIGVALTEDETCGHSIALDCECRVCERSGFAAPVEGEA